MAAILAASTAKLLGLRTGIASSFYRPTRSSTCIDGGWYEWYMEDASAGFNEWFWYSLVLGV